MNLREQLEARLAQVHDPPVLALAYLRLARSWICVQCEAIFTDDYRTCPACTSAQTMPLARWLGTVETKGVA